MANIQLTLEPDESVITKMDHVFQCPRCDGIWPGDRCLKHIRSGERMCPSCKFWMVLDITWTPVAAEWQAARAMF